MSGSANYIIYYRAGPHRRALTRSHLVLARIKNRASRETSPARAEALAR